MFLSLFLNLEQVTNTTSKINRISSLFAPRPSSLHNPASASMVLHSNPFPAGPGTSGLGSFSWTWTPFHVHMYTVEKRAENVQMTSGWWDDERAAERGERLPKKVSGGGDRALQSVWIIWSWWHVLMLLQCVDLIAPLSYTHSSKYAHMLTCFALTLSRLKTGCDEKFCFFLEL